MVKLNENKYDIISISYLKIGVFMKKLMVGIFIVLNLLSSANAKGVDLISSHSFQGSGKLENIVDKICIDGYVYINIYQRKPTMTIEYGRQTSLLQYPVMQGIVQSLIYNANKMVPERCKNNTPKKTKKTKK
jgi:hypothetical protein